MTSKKMETKNPRTRLLFTLLILAVFAFVGVKFVLDSYWSMTTEAYASEVLPAPTQLTDLRTKQKADLESGPTPINVAMQDIATKGRGSSPAITPQQSADLDPLRGWAKTKKDIPDPPPPPPPVLDVVVGDAGATPAATDGGAPKADAAAQAPKPDGGH